MMMTGWLPEVGDVRACRQAYRSGVRSGIGRLERKAKKIPYILPILREVINLPIYFQYLESWEPIPKVLPGLVGRRKCSTARQPTSKPLFEHKMTQNSLLLTMLLTSKSPPNVTSQSFKTLSERLGLFSPLIDQLSTAASKIFSRVAPCVRA